MDDQDNQRMDLIYHESQTAALCGVHAVNTLLQASHFSEVELAQIAQELDAAEHALMASGGLESADFLQYVAEGSGNVANDGMFSIQVLSRALEVFGLQTVPLSSPDAADARADPTTQTAFICNLQESGLASHRPEHWFTVRRIHDQWWNLNSVYSAPEPLSAFYLSAFLGTLQEQGYTIFVVVGPLPPSQPPASEAERAVPGAAGRWFSPEEARAATQERERLKQAGFAQAVANGALGQASQGEGRWMTLRRPGGAKRALDNGVGSGDGGGMEMQGDDSELARALAASLEDADGSYARGTGRPASRGFGAAAGGVGAPTAVDDEEADLAAAIAASLADSRPPQQPQQRDERQQRQGEAGAVGDQQEQQQQQLPAAEGSPAAAPAPSVALPELGPEPEAGAAGAVEVALRLPGGARASRRFSSTGDTVGRLAAFAAQQGADMGACQLAAQFPRRLFADWEQSLSEAGVGHKELVTVEPRQ